MRGPAIEFEGVGLTLGNTEILRDVSFKVRAGTIHCIVGANGGGDATLGILRVALVNAALREHQDAAVLARHQRRVEAGNPGADDDVVERTHRASVS